MKFEQPISEEIFKRKYMINGENTVEEVFEQVAEEIALAETTPEKQNFYKKEFLKALSTGKLIPGGRILANARPNSRMKNYNNCFTIDIEDSMEGIYSSLKEDAIISASGGGVGFDVSKLRPEGSSISHGGESTGPLSFLKVFDQSAKVIHTGGGRRSAHIALMNVAHPDIEKFITIKHGDKNKELTQFNISVSITDKFIEAVEKDTDWNLIFNGKIYKTIKARYLYDLLTKNAYEHNEPGIFNIDTVEKYNNGYWAFKLDRVNPCQPSWAKILTPQGIREIKDISVGDTIWSKDGWTTIINKWSSGIKKVYKYETTSSVFYGTENHKVISKGNKVEAKNAKSIESLRGHFNESFNINPQDVMDGLVIGDGSVHKASNNLVYLNIGAKDHDYFTSEIKDLIKTYRPGLKKDIAYEVVSTITYTELPKTYERFVPKRFMQSPEKIIGFLRGLFSANGSVAGNRITLKASSKQIIEDTQLMLNSIGIKSYYTTNKSKVNKFKNGSYTMRQSYDLNITTDREKFMKLIGFIQIYKNKAIKILKSFEKKIDYKIVNIEFISEEEVFDITVDNASHTYWTQGCNVSNCGEIVMPAYSLCCLSSINLSQFVINSFENNAYFDFEDYKKHIQLGVRFLDNVLDRTEYPLQKIKELSKKWRRIGLGFTGLGDAFAMMKIEYGSKESILFSEELAKTLRDTSYITSIELSREKGKFPAFDTKILESHFIKTLPENIQKDIRVYGLRNIALNTCAPNGTISLSVGNNCSSGIEPIFALHYDRNIRTGKGEETKKEIVYDYAFLKYNEWCKTTGVKMNDEDFNKSFVTTLNIDPYKSIDVQAIWQKYIDHSISKTANLPMNFSYEQYKNLFMYAYKKGLKGFTSFNPSGSMKGVLEFSNNKEDSTTKKIEYHNAPKRPNDLPCTIHTIKVKEEYFLVLIGLLNDAPYEVFATNTDEDTYKDFKYKNGIIRKKGKGNYNLIVQNGEEKIAIENIGKVFNSDYETMCRLLSTAIRHGTPLQFTVDQLSKDKNFISFGKAISRVLKFYIKEGEKVLSNDVCPECGEELIYQNGCKSCSSCFWSKCS